MGKFQKREIAAVPVLPDSYFQFRFGAHNFGHWRPFKLGIESYTLKCKPMNNYYLENEQDYLAAKFHISDSHIRQASHLAFLKIQSWKFALRTPAVGQRYRQEAEELIKKSFCTYVPNSFVLNEEGFYFLPLN